jgi:predicted nucleic acid-binding protein
MHRVVIDTNLYIDWLNQGRHADVLFQRDTVKYLSAVVMMELYAGAGSRQDQRLIERVLAPFAKSDRLLIPTAAMYKDAGVLLSELVRRPDAPSGRHASLSHDILIALSARAIGATVITQNARDFQAIQRLRSFRLKMVG